MIHIITTHYKTDAWLDLQRGHLEKYTLEPYSVLCGTYQVETPPGWEVSSNWDCHNIDYTDGLLARAPNGDPEHFEQVNYLANTVLLPEIADDDIFLFLDCDAFPCEEGWDVKVKKYLQDHDVVGVYRKEDLGIDDNYDNIPHLCFFATTKKTWIENSLLWSLDGSQNPQVGMKRRIEAASLKVKELHRTNAFNAHRVCFGIYDDLVYHHCCAIRGFHNQVWEGADFYIRRDKGLQFNVQGDMARVNAEIWHSVWNAIREDEDYTFVRRYFMGAS